MEGARMNNGTRNAKTSEVSSPVTNEAVIPRQTNSNNAYTHPFLASWQIRSFQPTPLGRPGFSTENILPLINIPPRVIGNGRNNIALQQSETQSIVRPDKGSFDKSRAPLKKRPTTPVPLPPKPLSRPVSSAHRVFPFQPAPFLRQTSSTFSVYKHHEVVPPQLRLTASRGRQLMSEPLLDTPRPGNLWPKTPSTAATMPSTTTPSFGDFTQTPGVTTKEVIQPPNLLNASTSAYGTTVNRLHFQASKGVPVPVNVPSTHVGFYYPGFPAPSRQIVVPAQPSILRRIGKENTHLFNNVPYTDRPCKCNHSRCLKLYCECFHHGFFCDEKLCRCKGCSNNEAHNEPRGEREIAIKKILARRPGAFGVRIKKKKGMGCGCRKSG